ncbi:4-oxalocrotonate tautomerase family protein [Streptomyces sp. I05A-00742]|uniref:tautomerase family protein n=1 Tax=Streptomyces sp. I05A-00742 TaxID=2732853 RepID=UPI00148835FE|nr:4-oxalocrotonate tautomerase family protein [Streptomyces sp. I05A-00742]
MPYIRVTVSGPALSPARRSALAEGLTALAVSALGKSAARTTVQVDPVPAGHYFVAGRPVTGATGAHVEVSITAGTNSADEKARFITETYALLRETLGVLPPVAGVALYELHPESYGYNGVTQLDHYRRVAHAAPDGTLVDSN